MRVYVLLGLFLAAGAVWAGPVQPCGAGTVATVVALGSCSIGNLVFDFTGYLDPGAVTYVTPGTTSSPGTNFDPTLASSVGFQPLTADPLAPGFRLTGPFWSSAAGSPGASVFSDEGADLDFSVSTADGSATIAGWTDSINGVSMATSADSQCYTPVCDAGTLLKADLVLSGGGSNFDAQADANRSAYYARSNYFPGSISTVAEASTQGHASFYSDATVGGAGGLGNGSASASASSIDYQFTLLDDGSGGGGGANGSVPEPSSWMLLGGAGIPFLLALRARRTK